MDPEQNSHEHYTHTAEPQMHSFIAESAPEEVPHEEFEDELSPEEKRDKSFSIVFALVGALAVIGAAGYFISNRMQPADTARPTDTSTFETSETSHFSQSSASENGYVTTDPNSQNQNFNYSNNAQQVPNTYVGVGQSDSIQQSLDITEPTEGTFAKPADDNSKYYDTFETVTRATSTSESTPNTREQTLSERVTIQEIGVSILKDPFWTQSVATNSLLLKKVGPTGKDTIFIRRFKGKYVSTQDPTSGNVTYFFDPGDKVWMRLDYTGSMPSDFSEAQMFVPMILTKQGKAILEGTTRYKTLIIALTVEDFLIVNITGTGYTKILDSFVKEIRKVN